MCDHGILIERCEDYRKVHHKFQHMLDNVIETALCMKTLMAELNAGCTEMFDLLKAPPKILAFASPHKRRKAQSFDSPSSTTVVRKEETPRNRSNPEVSASVLDQNIDFPDTEDSFFALTQSPCRREPLSPVKAQQENALKTPPKKDPVRLELFADGQDDGKAGGGDKKKKKSILSLSRFSTSFETSPETSKQAAMLPMRQKLTTPKPKGVEQENVIPQVGKWTAKKTTAGSGGKMDTSMRKTPTSSAKKDGTLLNRTRMRQTKLKFQDCMNKSFADGDDDETYFDEFVIPSPTSTTALSGTRFLKSAKKKEQSTLIAPPKPKLKDTPGDEDFDIDQTYFSEAEKDLTRSKQFARPAATRIKAEPLMQKKSPPKSVKPSPILAKDTQDSDTSSVVFVKPPSQDEIITIEETQPNKEDLFIKAIREQRRKEDDARQSVLNVMGPSKRDIKKEELFPTRSECNVLRKPLLKVPPAGSSSSERRCSNCGKQFQFLLNCGHTTDVARSKLPQNCRDCRLAQLHETPPGFWNPEFTPTQL